MLISSFKYVILQDLGLNFNKHIIIVFCLFMLLFIWNHISVSNTKWSNISEKGVASCLYFIFSKFRSSSLLLPCITTVKRDAEINPTPMWIRVNNFTFTSRAWRVHHVQNTSVVLRHKHFVHTSMHTKDYNSMWICNDSQFTEKATWE